MDAKTVVWLVQVSDERYQPRADRYMPDGRLSLGADPGSFVKAGPAGAVWRVLDVERLEVDVPESHPDDRIPYVGSDTSGPMVSASMAEACRRSAQVDRDELATLPLRGQPDHGPMTVDRAERLRASIAAWLEQAERVETRTMATNAFRVTLEAVDPHDVPCVARVVELPLPVMLLDGSEPTELRSRRMPSEPEPELGADYLPQRMQ